MNTFGQLFRTTIFGSSHGPWVGCIVEGIPPGKKIDLDFVQFQLDRRRPGQSFLTTTRMEEDKLEVVEGLAAGVAMGEPIVAIIKNKDVDSRPYEEYREVPRPGHADYTAIVKYRGQSDIRGGGQLSGRMTAPLVIAGALARQVLAEHGVQFYAHAIQIGKVRASKVPLEMIKENVEKSPVRCADLEASENMVKEVEVARKEGDSVGGIIEATVTGLPVGVGEPLFSSVESLISKMMFSIPAVKGVEFGSGFGCAAMRGSEHNDPFIVNGGRILTSTNNAGGILGGISNGMPVVFRVAIKPAASIAKKQRSVNLRTMQSQELVVRGRHDPCIVPRAVPVVENAAAIPILDLMMIGGFC